MTDDNNIDALRGRYPGGLHFVVGDTHGEYKTLKALMEKIQFDSLRDHVYFVGDYNAGGSPAALLDYISLYYEADYSHPGFHLIRGNHERELSPMYTLDNLPDILVLRMSCLNYYIVHAGMVRSAFRLINEDIDGEPDKSIFAYKLDSSCVQYNGLLRQIIWSRNGLYSQHSHWQNWPSSDDLLERCACIIHGHTPYCFFMDDRSGYGDYSLFWEKQHIWFSEDLSSFNLDSNIKGRFVNGEFYRGLSCLCLEVLEETAFRGSGYLTIGSLMSGQNCAFSAEYQPVGWGVSEPTEGDINRILKANPEMKTILPGPDNDLIIQE